MLFRLKFYKHHTVAAILILSVSIHALPSVVFAECKEFQMVEYEDRIEAVCVGDPLTPAQKQANAEEEKRQELENRRLRMEQDRRQKEIETADAKRNAQADAERKKQEAKPTTTKQNQDPSRINLKK